MKWVTYQCINVVPVRKDVNGFIQFSNVKFFWSSILSFTIEITTTTKQTRRPRAIITNAKCTKKGKGCEKVDE